ncbi:DEAD/DEAH box helicase [Caballeronia novacaledonica]|uniref:3'-5' exonuclease n=1 Tax=Caballeronia novacaledonica TaxID=1544861 RepID=UPI001EE1F64D|nr:3'-5' exonuclease [Caballeronia novacaledonica]GJH12719.1 DEAD/DEAH box helicase [Caballeronia novacaledonica]
MAKAYKPTAEQEAVVEAAKGGGDLKVKAYAGAGKTSTLQLVAQQLTGQRGSYLAFNKEIADSARRGFPANVSARTVHSLAYASAPTWLTARINLPSEPPHGLAARYGFGPIEVPTISGKNAEVAPFEVGRMIADGLGRFCRSADDTPQPFHIPVDEKIRDDAADWLREQLAPSIGRLWAESVNPRGLKAIQPDVYLKVWAQSNPRINADFILFDEAQDSDGIMLSVLSRQRHAQKIYVGDPYQQIYEWRGAVNAMAQINAPERPLTESFRFGPTFAGLASCVLALLGETTPIRGQPSIGSIMVEDPAVQPPVDAVLCRKNATAIWQFAAGIEMGHRPALRMNPSEIIAFADGADQLLNGRRAFRPTALSLFENWREAQAFARSAVGRDLLPVVEIVDDRGTDYLRALARRQTPEGQADYVISTIHRAKGLEWKRVRIVNDFRFKMVDGRLTLDEDEMRLLYVALTRAQHVLDISDVRDELLRLFNVPKAARG